jgi:hypothetical protein
MGEFKNRSDYFKSICSKNKLIADGDCLDETGERKSYFRINDEDEFSAACSHWIHFPCVVFIDYTFRYKNATPGKMRKNISNELWFISKIDSDANALRADALEAAYDEAMRAMDQFVSYLQHEMDTVNVCGELFSFDADNSNTNRLAILGDNLTGWSLTFNDLKPSSEATYDAEKWDV